MASNDVSSSVLSIISAFTSGLDIFKKIRERRRRKKIRKAEELAKQHSGGELQLSNSLRKGPLEIKKTYDRKFKRIGDRFAKGDTTAHASLTQTLIKLNTGLVAIISSFLNHDPGRHALNLDYKSLTTLSESSRVDAIDALNELYYRLSQSSIALNQPKHDCSRCKRHDGCDSSAPGPVDKPASTSSSRSVSHDDPRPRRKRDPAKIHMATIARVPVKSSHSHTQLAIVRPRNRRTESASSASSSYASGRSQTGASSTTSTTPSTSPLASPVLEDKHHHHKSRSSRRSGQSRRHTIDTSAVPSPVSDRRPQTWPNVEPSTHSPPPPPIPPKILVQPELEKKAYTTATSQKISYLAPPEYSPYSPVGMAMPSRRRADKPTPSAYSFASDSTKIGEIPLRSWTVPFDFEEADRLNAEAAVAGWQLDLDDVRERPRRKLFGFLRRGEGGT